MFQEVTTLAPDNSRGYSDLGAMYVLLGRYAEAIEVLQKSLSIRPTVEVYDNLGTAYFIMRKYDEAARNYEEGLKFEKTSRLTWGNLADAYYQVPDKRQKAMDAYREAIRLADEDLRVNPRDSLTWAFRATYMAMLDKKQDALASLQKAESLAPASPKVEFRGALVYNHFGDKERTIQCLRKALGAGLSTSEITTIPDFDHLRGDPAFQAILRGAKQ
jgi:tetratricopeptide (TPR) repeat protein